MTDAEIDALEVVFAFALRWASTPSVTTRWTSFTLFLDDARGGIGAPCSAFSSCRIEAAGRVRDP